MKIALCLREHAINDTLNVSLSSDYALEPLQ